MSYVRDIKVRYYVKIEVRLEQNMSKIGVYERSICVRYNNL